MGMGFPEASLAAGDATQSLLTLLGLVAPSVGLLPGSKLLSRERELNHLVRHEALAWCTWGTSTAAFSRPLSLKNHVSLKFLSLTPWKNLSPDQSSYSNKMSLKGGCGPHLTRALSTKTCKLLYMHTQRDLHQAPFLWGVPSLKADPSIHGLQLTPTIFQDFTLRNFLWVQPH